MVTKSIDRRVTYESGPSKSQIDYVLVRRSELPTLMDIKTIVGEECIQQHRLLVSIVDKTEQIRMIRQKPVSRCRVWRLKDANSQKHYMD